MSKASDNADSSRECSEGSGDHKETVGRSLAPMNRSNGFLLWILQALASFWENYCSIWGWTGVFHYRGVSQQKGRMHILQNNLHHDLCVLGQLLLAAFFAVILMPSLDLATRPVVSALVFALCAWNCIDVLMYALHLPLFALPNSTVQPKAMFIGRVRRRLLLYLIYFVQAIFSYAVVYWFLQHRFVFECDRDFARVANALQMSVATMTTVGYGTFAPVGFSSVLAAMLQAGTGLLIIVGAIVQLNFLLKTPNAGRDAAGERESEPVHSYDGKDASIIEWRLRLCLPPMLTAVVIGLLWWIAV